MLISWKRKNVRLNVIKYLNVDNNINYDNWG